MPKGTFCTYGYPVANLFRRTAAPAASAVDFQRRFAAAVTQLIEDPARANAMGARGRDRAVNDFGWEAIAQRTVDVYRSVVN